MQPFKFTLLDLGGGHVDGIPPTQIADREWAKLYNFYTYGPKLIYRGGARRLTGTYASGALSSNETLTSLFGYRTRAGVTSCIAGGYTGFRYLSGSSTIEIPLDFSLISDYHPAHYRQRNDLLYIVRPSATTLMRGNLLGLSYAGIAAPSTAPAIVDGAAGDLVAGDYYGVYTFYNSLTGVESNPSPVSAILTSVGTKKINWSGIQPSTTAQVTSRRLYRTSVDRTGEYFFVAQIDDNSTTTYVGDNVGVDDLGDAAEFTNGVPPEDVYLMEHWEERLWLSDGLSVFPSRTGRVESFDPEDEIQVAPDDGHKITGLYGWIDRLVIAKSNTMYYLSGVGDSSFELNELDTKHGCVSGHSIQAAEDRLFWFAGTRGGFRVSTGGPSQDLANKNIQGVIDNIPPPLYDMVIGFVHPSLNWYGAIVPQYDHYNRVLIYDYRQGSWSVFDHGESSHHVRYIAPIFPTDDPDTAGREALYCVAGGSSSPTAGLGPISATFEGYIFQYNDTCFTDFGPQSDGTPYTGIARTKAFDLGRPGQMIGLRRVSILAPSIAVNFGAGADPPRCYLQLWADGNAIEPQLVGGEKYIDLARGNRRWKVYNFSRYRSAPSSLIQLEIGYKAGGVGLHGANPSPWSIEGLILEGDAFDRSRRPMQ